MKVTLAQIESVGKGVESEYNSFIELLGQNLITRELKVGNFSVSTNVGINNIEDLKKTVDKVSSIGMSIAELKEKQLFIRSEINVVENKINCFRTILFNFKKLRLDLYSRREDISKYVHIFSELKYSKEDAEKYLTLYIERLYEEISLLRNEVHRLNNSECIEFDESIFNKSFELIKYNSKELEGPSLETTTNNSETK